jgi:hypothetical protein
MVSLVEELVLLAIEDDGDIAHTAGQIEFSMAVLGACLVELNAAQRITVKATAVKLIDSTPTGKPMLDEVLRELGGEEPRNIEQWILHLLPVAPNVVQHALGSLVGRKILAFTESRYLWVLKARRYPVLDGREQKEAKLRILATLLSDELPTPHDIVLLGLAHAGGLLDAFLSTAEIARLEDRMEQVSGYNHIVQGVEAAIREDQTERARAMMMPMY